MTSLTALAVCVVVSLILSIALLLTIARPLRTMMERICPGMEAVNFWSRFALVMLFLSPLFVAVTFGLPPASIRVEMEMGELIQRAVTGSIAGAFLAMLGMGIWVSSLAKRAPPPPPKRSSGPNELWDDRAGN